MKTKQLTREQIVDNTAQSIREKLDLLSTEMPKPSDVALRIALSDCHTTRRVNGRYKFRSRAPGRNESRPDGFEHLGDMLWRLIRYHRGSGDLMGYPFEYANDSCFDALDTVAVIVTGSRATSNWVRAIRGN